MSLMSYTLLPQAELEDASEEEKNEEKRREETSEWKIRSEEEGHHKSLAVLIGGWLAGWQCDASQWKAMRRGVW